ncbi:membrane protein [Brachybacterium faecium]|uniref:Probable membrane transporter protein n=1 Tax=Brachybacterium faecium (strain ATCC 43885 / DSM 4810 / JCM 11609 / LMG 19847 / NBRC 14762 / NCIMB 9860 / 6-10) TaxID=446465 RepID=C7MEK1_BRAFD|nr:sulfite exporter TauE/SafE family protein [Brachybacterium faecium]ACU86008.1 predicted permease [Brachybacterium faecium DSM 4810]SLM96174.1 membrane protein [Brachybacterium faecium]HJG50525.1 sulfite exporter TauE/SafE family protein [Brachybacterium faecium]
MEPLSLIVLLVMGVVAGAINAAVGSGSLLTLPVLMAVGLPPGVAVRTNTVGMFFSTVGSVLGYRREIAAEREHLNTLMLTATLGATAGALLLLVSPASALDVLVPVLIVFALVMVVFQKQFTKALRAMSEARRRRRPERAAASADRNPLRSPSLVGSLGAASVYGGYFTAAQGVLYLGILGVFTGRSMGSVNSIKNLMSLGVNLAAAVVYVLAFFLIGTPIVWLGSLAIAVGSLLGGFFGAHLAKRMPEWVLRGIIVVVALAALVREVL